MAGGYMGKVLWVDLAKGKLKDEALDEKDCRDYIGGYGYGAKIVYERQKAKVDPLGPEAILGFMTGPITGSNSAFGPRYTVLCKSPLTGGWGDANSGGEFGPNLKFAGYDGVFFTGISAKPVYLFIKDGKAELRDASKLWGKDATETEKALQDELGKNIRVACIGPSGEKLSLIAAVMNDEGRAAARSGVGAVMGSKRLKAIAVTGGAKVPAANTTELQRVSREAVKGLTPAFKDLFSKYGTPGITAGSALSGDSPVKNWDGIGVKDFPNPNTISDEAVLARTEKPYGCYRCPVRCGGIMKGPAGEYQYEPGQHRPEYETLCMFGTNLLNNNLESIMKANDICNRYGLDTISAGAVIAFTIDCYENGVITKADTGGIEMTWGNHRSIVAMTEKLAKREGFGDVIADGVKMAAERIGKGADKYAMHVGGEELPAHDSKFGFDLAATYRLDPTPGRHTQGREGITPPGVAPAFDPKSFSGRGLAHYRTSNLNQVMNSLGMCMFHYMMLANGDAVPALLNAVTGWDTTIDSLIKVGERIQDLRQAFNIREGINPMKFKVPPRTLGIPPQKEGPLAGVTVDEKTLLEEYMAEMDWDPKTAKPSKKRLLELG
ncbi:MAG: aldehyde ferredoxin oxidoreductase family protein, partial [Dehalococcoidales bacterium]|nr:aldehyde ferredoxin oxidoreductase family protein [Dehalococcoidales bacterium]